MKEKNNYEKDYLDIIGAAIRGTSGMTDGERS